ncbi:MAG TPA: hypothetical protein VI300_23760, partial [Solirubrobacter sp.]
MSALAPAAGADRVTFTFVVSHKARPGRYTLVLSCGSTTRRLRMTVIARKGKPGTSRRIVRGRIDVKTRKAAIPAPQTSPLPSPGPVPVPTATPTPTPTPTPVVPGPQNSFRAVYALASDQTETPGYVTAIVATINAVDGWFATQTFGGVMPRWIRDAGGAPQVTVVKLAKPAADYERDGLALVRSDLQAAAPLAAPTEKTVVWMEVSAPDDGGGRPCGLTSGGISWLPEKS